MAKKSKKRIPIRILLKIELNWAVVVLKLLM